VLRIIAASDQTATERIIIHLGFQPKRVMARMHETVQETHVAI
jgi:hypothetical protein